MRTTPLCTTFWDQHEAPFHHSLLTTFRKRFTHDSLGSINEALARLIAEQPPPATNEPTHDDRVTQPGADEAPSPKGQLLLDATCVPAAINYPTDLNLLTDAREKTEASIDHLHASRTTPTPKPRTYLAERPTSVFARGQSQNAQAGDPSTRHWQTRYLRRNLRAIAILAQEGLLVTLPTKHSRQLLVIQELYRQQLWMYTHRCHRIANRLVSLSQPHVRPIVRGKAGTPVKFGATISVSLVDGVSFVIGSVGTPTTNPWIW